MSPALISIDWGSTNCRASLLSADGAVLQRHDGGAGIFSPRNVELADQLREIVEPWRAGYGNLPVILSGMAGSRNGLTEVPYVGCPAGLADIASALWEVDPEILTRCWIVPGLQGRTPHDDPDLMRGEEVQILGLLEQRTPEEPMFLVLPGTHCKWVLASQGKVRQFATTVSGELFAALRQLGSLAALADDGDEGKLDRNKFLSVADGAARPGGLLHHLFGLRVGVLLGEFSPSELHSRLSALVIGHEIEAMLAMFPGNREVTVVSERGLGSLYCDALVRHDIGATFVEAQAVSASGTAGLARSAGILA